MQKPIGSQPGEHVVHVLRRYLEALRQEFVTGPASLIFVSQTVYFGDQELVGITQPRMLKKLSTNPDAFEFACRLHFVSRLRSRVQTKKSV